MVLGLSGFFVFFFFFFFENEKTDLRQFFLGFKGELDRIPDLLQKDTPASTKIFVGFGFF